MAIKRINDAYIESLSRNPDKNGIVKLSPLEKEDLNLFTFSACTGSKIILITAPKNAVIYHGPVKLPERRHYLFCFEKKYSFDNTVQAGVFSEKELDERGENGKIDLTKLYFFSPKDSVRVLTNCLKGNLRVWQGADWHPLFNPFLSEEKVKEILDYYKSGHINLFDSLEGFLRTRFPKLTI